MENSQNQGKKPTVIFLHIPKAAGTTLKGVVCCKFRSWNKYLIEPGENKQSSIDRLKQLPDSKKAMIRLVYGHMPYGIHKWLKQPTKYITILRDPLERDVSDYYFARRQIMHPLHSIIMGKNLSVEGYIHLLVSKNITNLQTRWIAGCVNYDSVLPPYDSLPINGSCPFS